MNSPAKVTASFVTTFMKNIAANIAANARKILHTIHLALGLVSGVVVFIVSLTGAVQVFEEELRNATQHNYLYTSAAANAVTDANQQKPVFVPPATIVRTMHEQFPQETIEQIRFRYQETNASETSPLQELPAFLVLTKSNHAYSIHPQTGRVLGVRDMRNEPLSVVLELHKHLLLGRFGKEWDEVGEEIIEWNVGIFTVLLLTGIVLWMPANTSFLRDMLKRSWRVQWRAAATKRNYDLHRVAGFYALWVMLIVAYSALYWTLDVVQDSSYALFGVPKTFDVKPTSKKAEQTTHDSVPSQHLYNQALERSLSYGVPYFVSMQFPKKESDALRVVVRYPYRFLRKQSVLYFDQYSGALLKSDLHEHYTIPDKLRVMNFDLHTGRIFGLPSKILWCLAALFTASLPVTGTLLWWSRRRKRS
jgi:uncharacterized iron-regulated membrane protein